MNNFKEGGIIKGYLEYQDKVFFFVFDNWRLELLPIEGLKQDFLRLFKALEMYKNQVLDITSILGYTSERKAIQFFGFEDGAADDGKLYFSVEYYLIGDKYFDDIKVSQLLVYSDIFINLFPTKRGVQIDKDSNISIEKVYDKLELGSGNEVSLFASSSEYFDLFGEIPLRYENYIGIDKKEPFSLEESINWFYALKNSLKIVLNTNDVGIFKIRICYKDSIDGNKQYINYLTLNFKQEEQMFQMGNRKDRWYNILDINFANLVEKVYKNEIKLDYIINRIYENSFHQARLIFDFAAIENMIKKKQDDYKKKYNDGFDTNYQKFYFRKALLIIYEEFNDCIDMPTFQINEGIDEMKKIRDAIAHGDLDIDISWDMVDYIRYYEKLIYVAILGFCEYPKEIIKKMVKKVFRK